MGNLLGGKDHLTGSGFGSIPGNSGEPSRAGQGIGIPKLGVGSKVPRSVSGPRSYGIRHTQTPKVGPITTKVASSSGKLPSIPKAPKLPKLGNEL